MGGDVDPTVRVVGYSILCIVTLVFIIGVGVGFLLGYQVGRDSVSWSAYWTSVFAQFAVREILAAIRSYGSDAVRYVPQLVASSESPAIQFGSGALLMAMARQVGRAVH